MKQSYLTNGLLVLLIIALYWFVNYEPIESNTNKTLSSLLLDHVHTIKIKRINRDNIVLNKIEGQWLITQPIQANANPTRVKLILALLSTVPHSQFRPEPTHSLQQFDLEPSKINVHINDQVFNFGDIEPLNHYRYIQHNDLIHLVDDTVAPLLNATASSFIDNRLLSDARHITKLSLPAILAQDGDSKEILLELQDGHWMSSNSKLSSDELMILIDAWQHAYAMQVLPVTDTIIGQSITVEFNDQTHIELLVQFDTRSMSIINRTKKLKYQFPLANKHQFFPIEDIEK